MTVFVFLWSIVKRLLHDLYCWFSSSQATVKLNQTVRGHFVMLTEVGMHQITCNPGHI